MSNKAVANRYAVALFELGQEKGQVDQFESDLELVREVFNETPELLKVLRLPGLPLEQKQELLTRSFENNVHQTVFKTISRLLELGRFTIIPELAQEYKQLNDEIKGIAERMYIQPNLFPMMKNNKLLLSLLQK